MCLFLCLCFCVIRAQKRETRHKYFWGVLQHGARNTLKDEHTVLSLDLKRRWVLALYMSKFCLSFGFIHEALKIRKNMRVSGWVVGRDRHCPLSIFMALGWRKTDQGYSSWTEFKALHREKWWEAYQNQWHAACPNWLSMPPYPKENSRVFPLPSSLSLPSSSGAS